ncbi:Domain of uncharacterised function (DUF2825) [Klebsiella pneumoniae]|nr:Domain of uncharacterised function (DUF2825) [Klebsiella pneumoniae]
MRFIPAGAGNTRWFFPVIPGRPVYPRWRGEHLVRYARACGVNGLSPLARGTQRRSSSLAQTLRFIPAGAGNTFPRRRSEGKEAVYPRWRGEHSPTTTRASLRDGLSPLARGTPMVLQRAGGSHRFIPAGAGNPRTRTTWAASSPVYPRWRGEHLMKLRPLNLYGGLSPLARGTPRCTMERVYNTRFIPAGAGNTQRQRAVISSSPVYPRWRGEHTKDILLFYNSFLSTQQFTNFITTISHY